MSQLSRGQVSWDLYIEHWIRTQYHFTRLPSNDTNIRFVIHDNYLIFFNIKHQNEVIMGAMASQITSVSIVYSTVYSGVNERKHQSSASLSFVRGIHWWRVNSPHKGSVMRKYYHLMMSSWTITEIHPSIFCSYQSNIIPWLPFNQCLLIVLQNVSTMGGHVWWRGTSYWHFLLTIHICKILYCDVSSLPDCQITTNLCTWYDSTALMSCTQFCGDFFLL